VAVDSPISTSEGLEQMTAVEAAAAIRDGRMTSRELTEACLARIERLEPTVEAWTFLDRNHALAQADAADDAHRRGRAQGPLHGVPVGVKDIFDTGDMPTEDGTVLHAGRTPRRDAAVVARLRQAGAVIMGKTVTTELAMYAPGKTANPHDPRRTPGGSSSGSAAAVASGMVPLALASQTNGSTIRPAAFCGIYGFKPTHGLIPRTGVLRLSRTLDQIGAYARSIEDIALMAECMIGFDEGDPDTRPVAPPPLLATARSEPPLPPRLAFVPSPVWDEADAETQEAFTELVDALGERISRLDLPGPFSNAIDWHRTIMETDLAVNLNEEYERGRDQLSAKLREMIERGHRHSAYDYQRAVHAIPLLNDSLEEAFSSYDALLTPAAPGVAPLGLDGTGSPIFCSTWTLCGVPALTLPLLQNEAGLPMGVQLIGARGNDAKLLRTAQWLAKLDLD
jgi:Asp-tRNA(Asn)/Glu-tRNA(Gln) amidotransferase A subunit family amidase